MASARYTYEVVELNGNKAIVITDKNDGAMSVANDIEYVVEEIANKEDINPEERFIVYKDTCGIWDGWDAGKGAFVLLNAQHWAHAINRFAKQKREDGSLKSIKVL